MNSRPFREPIWRAARVPALPASPRALRSWLHDQSSLSRRLQLRCGGNFNVEVVSERLERPSRSETALLGIRASRLAWVRTVFLRCGERRWVYGRTVIPLETLRASRGALARLGTRPLGEFLFSRAKARRGGLQLARARVPGADEPVFGRRSLFRLSGRALLVSEFFLAEFVRGLE